MSILKNWKGLYNTEKNNRKLYEERYKKIYDENIEYQKTIKELKYKLTKARIDLEDCRGFLKQEKEVSYALRQERNKLLNKNKQLKAHIKELKGETTDGE
jgi:chromosome segregation ATPase